ncbi:MAG: MbnP family protein [Flavobacteriales bacterium]
MKHILLFLSIFLAFGVYSQNSVILEFNHKVGAENLEFNSEFTIPSGDKVALDRCEYYISQIVLTHDGGTTTSIDDRWLLVDAFDQFQTSFDLGEHDINQVESITFWVGVETPVNNDDPSLWPNQHPLAPQNPSMHWGWAAGYRFLAMEGMSGTSGADFVFEVHALGNVNYHEQTVDLSASTSGGQINLAVKADYLAAFSEVVTSSGGITHGEDGDSVDMLNNFRDEVFSAGEVLSVNENSEQFGSVTIAPNPTANGQESRLLLELNQVEDFIMEITDISGKEVFSELMVGEVKSVNLPIVESGVYLINIKSSDKVIFTEKWVVNK